MKDKITNLKNDTKTAWHNFERLVEAASLLVVAGYAIYKNLPVHGWVSVVIVTAAAIIGVRGAVEFLKHLANK